MFFDSWRLWSRSWTRKATEFLSTPQNTPSGSGDSGNITTNFDSCSDQHSTSGRNWEGPDMRMFQMRIGNSDLFKSHRLQIWNVSSWIDSLPALPIWLEYSPAWSRPLFWLLFRLPLNPALSKILLESFEPWNQIQTYLMWRNIFSITFCFMCLWVGSSLQGTNQINAAITYFSSIFYTYVLSQETEALNLRTLYLQTFHSVCHRLRDIIEDDASITRGKNQTQVKCN